MYIFIVPVVTVTTVVGFVSGGKTCVSVTLIFGRLDDKIYWACVRAFDLFLFYPCTNWNDWHDHQLFFVRSRLLVMHDFFFGAHDWIYYYYFNVFVFLCARLVLVFFHTPLGIHVIIIFFVRTRLDILINCFSFFLRAWLGMYFYFYARLVIFFFACTINHMFFFACTIIGRVRLLLRGFSLVFFFTRLGIFINCFSFFFACMIGHVCTIGNFFCVHDLSFFGGVLRYNL